MLLWNGSNVEADFSNFHAYNNVFYNDKKYAFAFLDQSRHNSFSFFNNVFVASDSADIFDGIDSSKNDIFLGNVWMRKNGGFQQNGFSDLEKWSNKTGYEQHNGNFAGSSFSHQLFFLRDELNITEPYVLNKNPALLSLCNNILSGKGIDIRKIFAVDIGKTDFFGRTIHLASRSTPGVCESK